MTAAPRAGWYPDPGGAAATFRWWDGGDWTEHVSTTPHAPDPTEDSGDPGPRRRSPAQRVVALVLVVALVASAGAGVGLWLWQDADASPDAPSRGGQARSAPDSSGGPSGRLDPRTRTATIAQVTMVLPDTPYAIREDPWSAAGLTGAAFLAEAPVHVAYDGRNTWSATVALAWLDGSLVGTDLDAGASATVHRLAQTLYGGHPTRLSDLQVDQQSVDGYPAVMATATVHYKIDGLTSRHDLVAVHVLRLSDEVVVAGIVSVPDDADPAVLAQAQRSLDTLQAA